MARANWWLEDEISFWDGLFSGAFAVSFLGRVYATKATWRLIPVSKWLVTPIYKPFSPFGRGITLLRGLTDHLLTIYYMGWSSKYQKYSVPPDSIEASTADSPNPLCLGVTVGDSLHILSLFQDPLHKEFCIPKINHQVINQQVVPWREEPSFHEVVAFAEVYMSQI